MNVLKNINTKIIVIFLLSLLILVLTPKIAFAEYGEHTGDDKADVVDKVSTSVQENTNDNIPSLNIKLNGVTLDQINAGSKDTKYENNGATVNYEGQSTEYSNVRMKGRGNTTGGAPKKPYQIKFDSKVDLFGLGKAKKGCLMANGFDASNMRNDTAFKTAMLINLDNTGGGKLANLYVDGQYIGLYGVTHQVEVGKNTVDLGDQGTICEINWKINPDDMGFKSKIGGKPVTLADTAVEESEAKTALASFEIAYNNFENALSKRNGELLKSTIDVDSFVTFCVLAEFSYNPDTGGTSTYIYRDNYDDVIHCGPPWDYDVGYGNGFSDGMEWLYNDPYRSMVCRSNIFKYFMEIPEFRALFIEKYNNTLKPLKDEILNYIETTISVCYNEAVQNNNKGGYQNIDTAISNLKTFINKRFDYMDVLYGSTADITPGYYTIKSVSGAYEKLVYVNKLNDGSYELLEPYSNYALDVSGNSLNLNTPVQFYPHNDTDAQKGYISKKDNSYELFAKNSGLALSVSGGLHIADMSLSDTQLMTFTEYDDSKIPKPTAIPTGDGQVTLTWDAISGVTNYAVSECIDGNFNILTTTCTDTKYVVNNLANNYPHTFLVQAFVEGTGSMYTYANYVSATPQGTIKPVNISGVAGDTSIKLSGTPVPGASQYAVSIRRNDGTYDIRTTSCGENCYIVDGLSVNTEYTFLVQAMIYGNGSRYDETDHHKFTTKNIAPNATVENTGDGFIKLSGEAIENATAYAVSEYLGNDNFNIITTSCTELNYTINNLVNEQPHTFLVQAFVADRWSRYTSANYVTGTPTGPLKPYNITAVPDANSIQLNWHAVSGATNYAVSIRNADNSYNILTTDISPTSTTYNVSGLGDGTNYTFLVQAFVGGRGNVYTESDHNTFTTIKTAPKATVAAVGDGYVKLTGNAVDKAKYYAVSEYLGDDKFNIMVTTLTTTEYLVENLSNETNHTFLVQAYVGNWSRYTPADYVSATPKGPIKPKVSSHQSGQNSVTLNGGKVSGATQYAVSVLRDDGTYDIRTVDVKDLTYTVTGLVSGMSYKFLVQAYVNNQWSRYTEADLYEAAPL